MTYAPERESRRWDGPPSHLWACASKADERCQGVPPPYLLFDRQACRSATPWHRRGWNHAEARLRRAKADGPPRGRTSLDGFGDRPGRWTAALGAPCGNRTRIAGLEDRHSAVELKAHERYPQARKDILRPSAPRFRPDCHKAPRSVPGRTRWRRTEPTAQKQKKPRALSSAGF